VHAELCLENATELIDGHGLDFLSFKSGRRLLQ
jgi:hypothetical protein